MKLTILLLLISIVLLIPLKANYAQVWEAWIATYDGPGHYYDEAHAIAMDSSGNIYVTGESLTDVSAEYDYATVKYNSDGIQQWVARYNGPGSEQDFASSIVVDALSNVYVTGQSKGSDADFGIATIKYNTDGDTLWTARYDGLDGGSDCGHAIAIDGFGNVYVTGSGDMIGSGGEDLDYITIKYDSSGNELWVSHYGFEPGAGNDDVATSIAVDSSQNVYITGYSDYESSYEPENLDYATIKYDSEGNELWVVRYNGVADDEDRGRSIGLDAEGNLFVTGMSTGVGCVTIKYDTDGSELWMAIYDGPGVGIDDPTEILVDQDGCAYLTGYSAGGSANAYDCLTIKYDSFGTEQWVATYNGPGSSSDYGYGIALDAARNVYVTGQSYTGLANYIDYLTLKYDRNGIQQWVMHYDGPGGYEDYAEDIAVTADGIVYVTGHIAMYSTVPYNYDYGTIKYVQFPLPGIEISSDLLMFGPVLIGEQISLPVTIYSVGDTALVLSDVYTGSTAYQTSFNPADSLILPGDSLTIEVTFAPEDTIIYSSYLTIENNAELVEVQLLGIGIPPDVVAKENDNYPLSFRLYPCSPNPFNPTTTISFDLPIASLVELDVFDIQGCRVGVGLVPTRQYPPGHHAITFDGSNLTSGLYIYRLQTGEYTATGKMVLMK